MASRKKAAAARVRAKPTTSRKAGAKRGRVTKAKLPAGAGITVKDSKRKAPEGARKIGDVEDREEIIEVTLPLRGPSLPTADELGSPTFSTKRFAAGFAASRRDVDKV